MGKAFVRVMEGPGYFSTQYHVMSTGRYSHHAARLIKAFYSKKDAIQYRDALNGKLDKATSDAVIMRHS